LIRNPELVDRLKALLNQFTVRVRMFYSGALYGINDLPASADVGQLRLLIQVRSR
jgi:hypothetical protein